MRRWCLGTVLLAWPAYAQPPSTPVTLDWSAPPECPSRTQVVDRVEQFLHQSLSEPREQPLTVRGQLVESRHNGYSVSLEFVSGGQRRQRQVQHSDCAKLTEAAALLIAMAIDPERVQTTDTTAPATSSHGGPATEAKQATPENSDAHDAISTGEPRAASGRSLQFRLALDGWIQGGVLPQPEPGLGAEIGIVIGRTLRLGTTARYGFEQAKRLEPTSSAEARFSMWSLGVRGCWTVPARWEFAACAGAEMGRILGQGQGIDDARSASDSWAAVQLGVAETYYVTRSLGVSLGLDLGSSIMRPRFGVQGLGEVFRPDVWLLRGSVGVVVLFF